MHLPNVVRFEDTRQRLWARFTLLGRLFFGYCLPPCPPKRDQQPARSEFGRKRSAVIAIYARVRSGGRGGGHTGGGQGSSAGVGQGRVLRSRKPGLGQVLGRRPQDAAPGMVVKLARAGFRGAVHVYFGGVSRTESPGLPLGKVRPGQGAKVREAAGRQTTSSHGRTDALWRKESLDEIQYRQLILGWWSSRLPISLQLAVVNRACPRLAILA